MERGSEDTRAQLLERIRKLELINEVLMRRVEQSMDMQEDAFLLFQTATSLESKIHQRTAALNAALADLAATNQALERARDAANSANLAKSTFLANMSHELRTPLHGVLSFARFGIREASTGERGDLLDYFSHIHESGQTLLSLLNELLDLAKLESGLMRYEWTSLDLGDTLSAVVDEFDATCRERAVTLVLEGGEKRRAVNGDALRLRQVFRNLVDNAVRYTRSRVVVAIGDGPDSGTVRVEVMDDGPGIPDDELNAVFEKFVQSSTTRSGAGGTGLGLAITREILVAHRGRAWAGNAPGGGAILTVELPICAGEAETAGEIAA